MNTSGRKEWTFDVVGGPSKDRIFDSCKHAYDEEDQISVKFKVILNTHEGCDMIGAVQLYMADTIINKIEHEDGSGHSFNLGGYCKADLGFDIGDNYDAYYIRTGYHKGGRLPHPEIKKYLRNYYFDMYYNVKSRRGWITFHE